LASRPFATGVKKIPSRKPATVKNIARPATKRDS
jgi:hypothetical protein